MKKSFYLLVPAVFALLACLPAARAATYTFADNASDTQNWSTGTDWGVAPVSSSATTLLFTGTQAASSTQVTNNDLGTFVLNSLSFTQTGPASGTAPTLTITGGTLEFANNGATGPTLTTVPAGTVKPILTIANNIQLDNNLTLNPSQTNLTLSGVVSGVGGLVMNNTSGIAVLTNANTYTGPTNLLKGNITVSGTGSLLSTSAVTVGGLSTVNFTLDYTGAAGNANVNRLSASGTLTAQGNANLYFLGNATTATNDSIGILSLGGGSVYIGLSGGTGVVTKITAAAFSRGTNNGTGVIRGTALGTMGSATTATQLLLTNAAGVGTQVGTTAAVNLATGDTTKNLQIVPYLVGDSTYNTGNGNTFVTYDATLGFRLLSTTNEFNDYATAATGDNVNITAVTTGAATKTINSLLTSKSLTGVGGGSNVLTVSSGAILTTGSSIISGFDGITLGNNEGVITTAATVLGSSTTTIISPITINNGSGNGGALTKSGLGTLILLGSNNYTGATTINQGLLQVGNGGSTGNLGNTSSIVLASGLNGGSLLFNTTSALNIAASVTGSNGNGAVTRAATSTGALTLGSVSGIASFTDNSTNGASAPTTFNQVGTGNTIPLINGTTGSVVNFAGTGSTLISNNLATPGQLIKVTSGNVTLSTTGATTYSTSNLEVDGGSLIFTGVTGGMAYGSLTITGGTTSFPGPGSFRVNNTSTINNAVSTINQSGGSFVPLNLVIGNTTNTGLTSNYNLSGGILSGTGGTLTLSADAAGSSTATVNLSGGKLLYGTVTGGGAAGAKEAFVWTGGTLAVGTFTATNLTSGSGVAVVTGVNNTLTNSGGILAPGDTGSGGKLVITGNYAVTSPNAVYAVDIGSATAASSGFTAGTSGAAFYDQTTVSGTTTLGGRLNVGAINGYTPNNATNYSILVGSASGVTGSFTNQVTATSGNSRVLGADGLSSFLVGINNTGSVASAGGLTSVAARTVALGGYQAANTYNAASGGTWDAANAASWTNFDPGATAAPATQASSAIAQFADGATGSGANSVSLNSTRNIQGVQFASTTAGHNYTIAGSGTMILDNSSNAATATIADSSVSGNANAINVPITLNSNLALSVANAANVLTVGGAIGETAVGSTLTKTGSGTAILAGANTYTGATTVSSGKLIVSGGIQGSVVNVATGAVLAGTGAIATTTASGNAVDIFGTLAPGDTGTIGQINFTLAGTAKVAFEAGSTLTLNVGASNASSTVAFNTAGNWLSGSGNATLALNGTIDYNGTYTVFHNVNSLFTFASIANYDNVNYTANLAMVGSNETLTFVAVPEPGTWAMLVSGLGMLIGAQKMRRRSAR